MSGLLRAIEPLRPAAVEFGPPEPPHAGGPRGDRPRLHPHGASPRHGRDRGRRAGALRRGLHQLQGAPRHRRLRPGRDAPRRPPPGPRRRRRGRPRGARRHSPASFYGGVCLGPVNTTAGHAVAYPLGTRHQVPHGAACALVFLHTLAFNAPAARESTEATLLALGLHAAAEDDLGAMADEAHAIRRLLDNNPREMGRDDILAIYEAAF